MRQYKAVLVIHALYKRSLAKHFVSLLLLKYANISRAQHVLFVTISASDSEAALWSRIMWPPPSDQDWPPPVWWMLVRA